MEQNIYKRVEALERIHAEVVTARAYSEAAKSATEWLEELELRYGIEQRPGEARASHSIGVMRTGLLLLREPPSPGRPAGTYAPPTNRALMPNS